MIGELLIDFNHSYQYFGFLMDIRNFTFDILLNKNEKSTKLLTINADASLDKSYSGTIENQTTMLFIFDAAGELVKSITYGLKQNLKFQAPHVQDAK